MYQILEQISMAIYMSVLNNKWFRQNWNMELNQLLCKLANTCLHKLMLYYKYFLKLDLTILASQNFLQFHVYHSSLLLMQFFEHCLDPWRMTIFYLLNPNIVKKHAWKSFSKQWSRNFAKHIRSVKTRNRTENRTRPVQTGKFHGQMLQWKEGHDKIRSYKKNLYSGSRNDKSLTID